MFKSGGSAFAGTRVCGGAQTSSRCCCFPPDERSANLLAGPDAKLLPVAWMVISQGETEPGEARKQRDR